MKTWIRWSAPRATTPGGGVVGDLRSRRASRDRCRRRPSSGPGGRVQPPSLTVDLERSRPPSVPHHRRLRSSGDAVERHGRGPAAGRRGRPHRPRRRRGDPRLRRPSRRHVTPRRTRRATRPAPAAQANSPVRARSTPRASCGSCTPIVPQEPAPTGGARRRSRATGRARASCPGAETASSPSPSPRTARSRSGPAPQALARDDRARRRAPGLTARAYSSGVSPSTPASQ
jgi:hypothetical protein